MKSVLIVYKTDAWHSYASRDLIGIATTLNKAISIIKEQMEKEGHPLKDSQEGEWLLELLRTIKQTQGYEGNGEFVIEEVAVNKLF